MQHILDAFQDFSFEFCKAKLISLDRGHVKYIKKFSQNIEHCYMKIEIF